MRNIFSSLIIIKISNDSYRYINSRLELNAVSGSEYVEVSKIGKLNMIHRTIKMTLLVVNSERVLPTLVSVFYDYSKKYPKVMLVSSIYVLLLFI